MKKAISPFLFCSLFSHASCSVDPPKITSPAVLKRTLDNDPAFRGYTSTLGSWSPLYCIGDYTYSGFGNIADCCPIGDICHPATACGTDFEGSSRAIKFQGGETLTCFDTTCGTQTIYRTEGDSRPLSIFGCFGGGELYLTTPGSPASASASTSTDPPAIITSSPTASSSSPSASATVAPASTSSSHVGLIAGGVAVGVVLLLAIAGLIAWVIILKKRNSTAKASQITELHTIQGEGKVPAGAPSAPSGGPNGGFKAELPTDGAWAAKYPSDSAPPSRQEQQPWSNLNPVPQSPVPSYSPAPPYEGVVSPLTPAGRNNSNYYGGHQGPNVGMAELSDVRTHHQELPGSARPQYSELG